MLPIKKVFFNRRKDNKVRYSANRVYTGKPELEHTNSNLFITLAMYNKKKAFFERKLRRFIVRVNTTGSFFRRQWVKTNIIFITIHLYFKISFSRRLFSQQIILVVFERINDSNIKELCV